MAITLSFSGKLFALSSPFISTVPGLDIPNAHKVYQKEGTIIRSMAPRTDKDYQQLVANKFTDILIFKNQTRKEVDQEIEKLVKLGFKRERIYHIPFKWKDFGNF